MPGLWQGGTHGSDTVGGFGFGEYQPTKDNFDTVITLYGHANPAGRNVKELRLSIIDGDMSDFDANEDLYELVQTAHRDWMAGKRVLIRCQAGWNRSGLVMALTLIKAGAQPQEAIDLIRKKRVPEALSNRHFEQWLLHDADLEFWRRRLAA